MSTTAKPSAKVQQLLDFGWTAALGGFAALSGATFDHRGRGPHRLLDVFAGERHVQIYVSPTGRSVRIYVDGAEAKVAK